MVEKVETVIKNCFAMTNLSPGSDEVPLLKMSRFLSVLSTPILS